jgi:hypothetical protein
LLVALLAAHDSDKVASACSEWSAHCVATHKSDVWRQRRDERRGGVKPKAAAGSLAASAAALGMAGAHRLRFDSSQRLSCDEFLDAIKQVYPIEEKEPSALVAGTVLRPYQKQSLAFMKHVERSNDSSVVGNSMGRSVRGGWLCDEVGMGKTLVITSLVLAEPAKSLKPITEKAFRDFMQGKPAPFPSAELAFKCTLVIVNNTLVQQWADEISKFAPSLSVQVIYAMSAAAKKAALQRLRTCDVLLTTPHMIGTANGVSASLLASMRFHRLVVDESHLLSTNAMGAKLPSLRTIKTERIWCVTGTPCMTALDQLKPQARLLGMESALANELLRGTNEELIDWLKARMIRHTKSMRIGGEVALALPDADCVTVWLDMPADERLLYGMTECDGGHTLGLVGGANQTRFRAAAHLYDADIVCGQRRAEAEWEEKGNRYMPLSSRDPLPSFSLTKPHATGAYPEAAKTFLRLHEAVQVPVKPSKAEKLANPNAPPTFTTEYRPRKERTKFATLLQDLVDLRKEEPAFHAVVFTRFDQTHAHLVRLIHDESTRESGALYAGKSKAVKIFEFSKATAPTARHKRISEFQRVDGEGKQAKIFIVTFESAAVGITLTAASRIFLMEVRASTARPPSQQATVCHTCPSPTHAERSLPVFRSSSARVLASPPSTPPSRCRRPVGSTAWGRRRTSSSGGTSSATRSRLRRMRCTARSRAARSRCATGASRPRRTRSSRPLGRRRRSSSSAATTTARACAARASSTGRAHPSGRYPRRASLPSSSSPRGGRAARRRSAARCAVCGGSSTAPPSGMAAASSRT